MQVPVTGRLGFMARIDNTLFEPAPHGRIVATDVRWAGKLVDDSIIRFQTRDGVAGYHGDLLGKTVQIDGTLGLWGFMALLLVTFFLASAGARHVTGQNLHVNGGAFTTR